MKMYNFNPLFKNFFVLYKHETVRWASRGKKPFWLGIAKTKISKVKNKKPMPENEFFEYVRLIKEYNILKNSLCEFLKLDIISKDTDSEIKVEDLEKEIELSYEVNDMWNAEIAAEREERMQIEMDKVFEWVQNTKDTINNKNKNFELRIDEIVQQEIEKSKSFITFENLGEEIEKSIQNVKDYNFALDLQGKKYEGSESFERLKMPDSTKIEVD